MKVLSHILLISKRRLYILCVVVLGMAFLTSFFITCAPDTATTTTNSSRSVAPNSDTDDDEDNDDLDGYRCEDDSRCRNTCDSIYDGYIEYRSCVERGDRKVGRLEKVHNYLMGKKKGTVYESRSKSEVEDDLNKIYSDDNNNDDDDEIDLDELEDYLEIGVGKYISRIKDRLGNTGNELLLETIKWIVENEKVAEVLKEEDGGNNILRALLLEFEKGNSDTAGEGCGSVDNDQCLERAKDTNITSCSNTDSTEIWKLNVSSRQLKICYHDGSSQNVNIDLSGSTEDIRFYNALSLFYFDTGLDGGSNTTKQNLHNIFSYAVDENNKYVFDMAFDLLKKACEGADVTGSPAVHENKACARALFCWTVAVRGEDEIWDESNDYIRDNSNYIDYLKVDNNSDYNDCTAEKFEAFFSS